MKHALQEAASDASQLLAQLGRASTPPVKDRELPIRTHIHGLNEEPVFPVAVIGSREFLEEHDVATTNIHPNTIDNFVESPGRYQALLVNARDMSRPWQGALTGSAAWKSQKIYEACSVFRAAGIPVYIIKSTVLTTPFLRWQSLASAIFPQYINDAEETGNPQTPLWHSLMGLENEQ